MWWPPTAICPIGGLLHVFRLLIKYVVPCLGHRCLQRQAHGHSDEGPVDPGERHQPHKEALFLAVLVDKPISSLTALPCVFPLPNYTAWHSMSVSLCAPGCPSSLAD